MTRVFYGAFFDLTSERLRADPALSQFQEGFDVLLEDTTFQMYGPDRDDQLAFIVPKIRPEGILIVIEKLAHTDENEYLKRECQKDDHFKSRYFSSEQIRSKNCEVLKIMRNCEVRLDELRSSLSLYFRYSIITWNSGNFYTIASTNSVATLRSFVGNMCPPALPSEFCFERLPSVLLDAEEERLSAGKIYWRKPRTCLSQGKSAPL